MAQVPPTWTDDVMADRHPSSASAFQPKQLAEQPGRLKQKKFVGLDLDAAAEVEGDVAKVGAFTQESEIGGIVRKVVAEKWNQNCIFRALVSFGRQTKPLAVEVSCS